MTELRVSLNTPKFIKEYKENLILLLAHFSADLCQGSVSAALTVMLEQGVLHNKQEMSYLVLASTLVSSLIQPLVGYLSDRKPRPYLMSLGIIVAALGLMFIGLITDFSLPHGRHLLQNVYAFVIINGNI